MYDVSCAVYYAHAVLGPGCLETRPPDVAAPVCAWPERASRMGPGFGQGAGTEVPLWGGQAQFEPGAAAKGIGSLGARKGGGPCCMMGIRPSAESIALSCAPAGTGRQVLGKATVIASCYLGKDLLEQLTLHLEQHALHWHTAVVHSLCFSHPGKRLPR